MDKDSDGFSLSSRNPQSLIPNPLSLLFDRSSLSFTAGSDPYTLLLSGRVG
jgi:hypothetical protein